MSLDPTNAEAREPLAQFPGFDVRESFKSRLVRQAGGGARDSGRDEELALRTRGLDRRPFRFAEFDAFRQRHLDRLEQSLLQLFHVEARGETPGNSLTSAHRLPSASSWTTAWNETRAIRSILPDDDR
jgi:hypothetical protein